MNPATPSAAEGAPPSVFICYRREDTAAHAGRLYDSMVARFGERNVFMDVDIAPGANFVERITEVVSGCVVLILMMGPDWATVEDGDGEVRLANPDDFVRLEIETALRRPEVTLIPVLVSGARMPRREELPPRLHPITHRNALELSDMRWGSDIERLHTTLDVLLADTLESEAEGAPPPAPPAPEPAAARRNLAPEGALVAAGAAFAARLLAEGIPEGSGDATDIANVVATRGATWALVALALVAWLVLRTSRRGGGRLAVRGLVVGALAGAIGGAIWALPVFLSEPALAFNGTEASWIQVGSLAVTGGLLGGLLGQIWDPPRVGAGLVCGAAAGALVQIATIGLDWALIETVEIALYFAIAAAAVAGLALAVLSRPRW